MFIVRSDKTPISSPFSEIFTQGSKDLEHKLKQIWFTVYRRNSDCDGPNSNGFEHTFVAEYSKIRRDVFGFHNWLYFAHEEEKGELDHFGIEKMVDLKGVRLGICLSGNCPLEN